MRYKAKCILITLLVFFTNITMASSIAPQLAEFKKEWAHIKYELPADQKAHAMDALIKRGDHILKANQNSAEMELWQGTALSTYASYKGGLSALSAAKKAKKHLEKAVSINPRVEQGQAHVILGALYGKVPGKPLGFGDKNKAQYHFQTALSMNENNLDAHFFYGEFLQDEGKKDAARKIYEKGLKVAQNTEFKVADTGRRNEIRKQLNSLA